MKAAGEGHCAVVKTLLDNGARVDFVNKVICGRFRIDMPSSYKVVCIQCRLSAHHKFHVT